MFPSVIYESVMTCSDLSSSICLGNRFFFVFYLRGLLIVMIRGEDRLGRWDSNGAGRGGVGSGDCHY